MKNKWSDSEAAQFIARYGQEWGEDLALRTYTSRLIGREKALVLHGGGNTSVKSTHTNIFGQQMPVLFVKASGYNLAEIQPDGHIGLELSYLQQLRSLKDLSDEAMINELRTHLLRAEAATPSIETLMHAFLPPKYIDHTHSDSILILTNRPKGEGVTRQALGEDVVILPYVRPGFALAKAVARAFEAFPEAVGMVLLKHGLLTWGETARQSYERTIELVNRAEEYLTSKRLKPLKPRVTTPPELARERYLRIAPLLRGLLALPTGNPDWPYQRFIIQPLITRDSLGLVDSIQGKETALTPPLTCDHLIRTKPFPLWVDEPNYEDEKALREQLSQAIDQYGKAYDAYFQRHSGRLGATSSEFDPRPRVILLPGLGAVCVGRDAEDAEIVKDITARTLTAKRKIAATARYEGLNEGELFDMEYLGLQQSKLTQNSHLPLRGIVALVTGAAGAIGSAISEELLKNGSQVALTDLPGQALDSLIDELKREYGPRVIGIPLDVTDPQSVARGFDQVVETWGGIDLVIANAGVAHVSSLAEMDPQAFQKLERVNVEGTLYLLSQAARHFRVQATGGDIVLVSTKNVFSPGAKFGAYSATKAAAHQLARIASLELAELGVRVNMVAPDAVFGYRRRRSGLWAEVGPDRMRARGLDEKGLEEYYRNRNLLKAKITATHVAKAVLFFVTHQTPTTGATIPVDGGLPEATPR